MALVFFYLNYDNPVSADDYKYALVGCARLADVWAGTSLSMPTKSPNCAPRPSI